TALVCLVVAPTAFAAGRRESVSPDGVWRSLRAGPGPTRRALARPRAPAAIRRYALFQVDGARLNEALGGGGGTRLQAAAAPLSLPMPDGSFTRIAVREDSMLGPDLQAAYPDIRTFSGEGLDDPTMTVVLDRTELGFHAQILGAEGTVIVDPMDRE